MRGLRRSRRHPGLHVDGARAAYAKIPTGSARYASAQGKIAWTLQNAGDKDKAIAVAEAAAKADEMVKKAEAEIEGVAPDSIIDEIVTSVEVPR